MNVKDTRLSDLRLNEVMSYLAKTLSPASIVTMSGILTKSSGS